MSAKEISELIRRKKKEIANAEPEMVGGKDEGMTPDDIMTEEMDARIQDSVHSEPKGMDSAEDTQDPLIMGPTDEEKGRMERLRKYLDTMDMDDKEDKEVVE